MSSTRSEPFTTPEDRDGHNFALSCVNPLVSKDVPDRLAYTDTPVTLTDAERRKAALTVARHARDAADARELLAALGLLEGLSRYRRPAA